MKLLFILSLILHSLVFTLPVSAESSDLYSKLQNLLEEHGPKYVISEIGKNIDLEIAIDDGISSANTQYLKLVNEIILFSDGAVSEGFSISLGEALEKDPDKVFQLMPNLINNDVLLGYACHSLPICEEDTCHQEAMRFAKKRVSAIADMYKRHPSAKALLCKTEAELVITNLQNRLK